MKKSFLLLSVLTSLSFSVILGCVQPEIAPGNKPNPNASATPSNNSVLTPSQKILTEDDFTVNKSVSINPLAIEKNMARLSGTIVNVSTTYEGWPKERLTDGDIQTSWFTAVGDAANLGKSPFVQIIFPQPIKIQGINFRGNREYKVNYDVLEGILSLTDKVGKNYVYTVKLPMPDRDFDVTFKNKINDIVELKFTFTKDQSDEPGFAEIEVDGSK